MDRLKTFGIWILLIIAFYIYSQVITYLFFYKENSQKNGVATDEITNTSINETNNNLNNAPINRVEILN